MPEYRRFRGQEVKVARKVNRPHGPMIRIIFIGPKGVPGKTIEVTPEEYDKGVERYFRPGLVNK